MDDFPIYTRDGNRVRKGQAKPEIQYLDDALRGMITGFMNHGAARGQAVYVNNKGGQRNWPDGVGCLEKDNLKMKVIGPKWQSCTTFGTSFGYLEGDRYKSIEDVMHEMIEVISRNGNFLVNIGPKADGTIPAPQVERLRAMGTWLKINGAAIYGSRYWKVCDQENEHLAFTTKGKNLYAIKLAKPTKPFTIEATAEWSADTVKSVKLLGSPGDVQWQMTPAGLHITPPAQLGESNYAWSFEIVTDQEQHTPNVIVKDADQALKNTKQVDLEGNVRKSETQPQQIKNHDTQSNSARPYRRSHHWQTGRLLPKRITAGESTAAKSGTAPAASSMALNGLAIENNTLSPTGKEGTYHSKLQRFKKKRTAQAITLTASTRWDNWQPTEKKVCPPTLGDAPIFLAKGPNDYWILGRHRAPRKAGFESKHRPTWRASILSCRPRRIPSSSMLPVA